MTRPRIVADCSAVMAWALNETPHAEQVRDAVTRSDLVVPPVWRLEVVNTVLVQERRRRLTPERSAAILDQIERLGAEQPLDLSERSLPQIAQLARPHQLSSYDAAYLDIAVSLGLPLLTLDNNLQDAARRLGVPLVLDRQSPAP